MIYLLSTLTSYDLSSHIVLTQCLQLPGFIRVFPEIWFGMEVHEGQKCHALDDDSHFMCQSQCHAIELNMVTSCVVYMTGSHNWVKCSGGSIHTSVQVFRRVNSYKCSSFQEGQPMHTSVQVFRRGTPCKCSSFQEGQPIQVFTIFTQW